MIEIIKSVYFVLFSSTILLFLARIYLKSFKKEITTKEKFVVFIMVSIVLLFGFSLLVFQLLKLIKVLL